MSDPTTATSGGAPDGLCSARYATLVSDREPYLIRAREMAGLTIPYLFRPIGETGTTQQEIPWNSLGAHLVSTLASKVVFSIWPPDTAPFKLSPDQQALEDLRAIPDVQHRADLLSGMLKGLSRVEREFTDAFEQDGDRAKLTIGTQKLIVGGTHGFEFKKDGQVRGISLDNFVNQRDLSGNLIEFCIEDWLTWETVDAQVRAEIIKRGHKPEADAEPFTRPSKIAVYTYGRLCVKPPFASPVWDIWQETWGFQVDGSRYTRYSDELPFLFCPWVLLEKEHYGRSYVENYEADLQTVEGNTQTATQGSAAMAKLITLVKPGGYTSKKALAEAETGAVIAGRVEDVGTIQSGKAADLQVAMTVTDKAEQRLNRGFLANSSIQRQGERVTAEEIRFVAQELSDALGGVYSQQAVTFQTPYNSRKLSGLQRSKRVTNLPKGTYKVAMTGGIAALSRNGEMRALDEWGEFMTKLFGPNWQSILGPKAVREIAKRSATALGINQDGLIPTDEEADQMDQQQQTQAALSNPAAVEGLKQIGTNLTSTQVAATNAQAKLGAETIKQQPQPAAAA